MRSRIKRITEAAEALQLVPLLVAGEVVGALPQHLRVRGFDLGGVQVEVRVRYYGAGRLPRVMSLSCVDPEAVLPEVVNLPRLARDVVVRCAGSALVHTGDGRFVVTTDPVDRFRLVGAVLLDGERGRPTDTEVIAAWTAGLEAGTPAADIAATLGLSPSRLRGLLADIRERSTEDIPLGKAGRRPNRTEA